jgi:hypothetical protein
MAWLNRQIAGETPMLDACACMGPRPGDEFCYCQLKARGMSTAHYEWTVEEKQKLDAALKKAFGSSSDIVVRPSGGK